MPRAGTRVFERLPIHTIEPRSVAAYLFAVASSGIACTVRLFLGLLFAAVPPFATFLVATMVTAILAGKRAGATCAVVGLLFARIFFYSEIPAAFGWGGIALYLLTSTAIIWIGDEYRLLLRRVEDREAATARQARLIQAENKVITMIAANEPLQSVMTELTGVIEDYSDRPVMASILLLDADGKHLRHCAAPNLPAEYNAAIDGIEIGPEVGSCGTAAYYGKPVYVSNIAMDPLWRNYRELAAKHGLKACWSTPILSRSGIVLGTFAIYCREPLTPTSSEIAIVALLVRIAALAIDRARARAQRQLLTEELSHRMKNLLSVVTSIASSTLRSHVDASRYTAFERRISALAKSQSLLTRTNWDHIDILELVRNVATEPFKQEEERFSFSGTPMEIPSHLAMSFALIIHELCTNAAKYGCLSTAEGKVNVFWGQDHSGEENVFFLRWEERGGPVVTPPQAPGFGSRLIKATVSGSMGGEATWRYMSEGLQFELRVPFKVLSSMAT